MDTLFARFKEPSTFAGLAGIALAIGHGFPSVSGLMNVLAVGLGSMAAMMGERQVTGVKTTTVSPGVGLAPSVVTTETH